MSQTHQQAFYNPLEDLINMPIKESFKSKEEYYSTLFHEMVHSTGHSSRLNRNEVSTTSAFGSDNYSKEELIAEMGSAFLCAQSGISVNTLANSAAYISFWLNKLKQDSRILFQAASQAQKAVDYMTNTPIEDNGQDNH
jgi:antirestriction protein ArdC